MFVINLFLLASYIPWLVCHPKNTFVVLGQLSCVFSISVVLLQKEEPQ